VSERNFRILIVDDEPNNPHGPGSGLAGRGPTTSTPGPRTGSEASRALPPAAPPSGHYRSENAGPDRGGSTSFRQIKHERPENAHPGHHGPRFGSRPPSRAMRLGAHDYISKPLDLALPAPARPQCLRALSGLAEENRQLRERLARDGANSPEMIGQSTAMREVFAPHSPGGRHRRLPSLIQGESGTGKELVARAIHNLSSRRDQPFVAASIGALPESLIESELFGHEKGAFTGRRPAEARLLRDGRRVERSFLDEVGEMPAKTQVDLLRVPGAARSAPGSAARR